MEASQLQAWLMDDSDADARLPHQCALQRARGATHPSLTRLVCRRTEPLEAVSAAALRQLGVLTWHLPVGTPASAARLAAVRAARGYSYSDAISLSGAAMAPEEYAAKRAMFLAEHIHSDEEVRYVTGGGGYFDVRSGAAPEARWVRIHCAPGDMIVLPAGCLHRFSPDAGDRVDATRLFVGEPVWTPIARGQPADDHPARRDYVQRTFGAAAA